MSRWCKQLNIHSIMFKLSIGHISVQEASKEIFNEICLINYSENDSPLYSSLNEYLKDLGSWFDCLSQENESNQDDIELAIDELNFFGDQIIKDSILKCRKVKALCVVR